MFDFLKWDEIFPIKKKEKKFNLDLMLFWILNSRKSEKLLRAGLALLATFFQVCTAPHFNVTETHASTPSKVDTIHWSHCVLLASKAAVWVRPLFTAKFFIS